MPEQDWIAFFRFEPETGNIFWAKNRQARFVGQRAEALKRDGYLTVRLRGKTVQAHRLAWLLYFGEWPKGEIDHVNLVRTDNRIVNLRLATRSQNQANVRPRGSLPKGVTSHKKTGKFQAQLKVDGENHYLGLFDTVGDAAVAYSREAIAVYGEFARFA